MGQCLFEIEIFCNIMNVFSVTVSELNASSLNKTIHLYKCYSNVWLQFVSGAKEICFTLWRGGYWADFINPLSGKAVSTFISVQADEKLVQLYNNTSVFCCSFLAMRRRTLFYSVTLAFTSRTWRCVRSYATSSRGRPRLS